VPILRLEGKFPENKSSFRIFRLLHHTAPISTDISRYYVDFQAHTAIPVKTFKPISFIADCLSLTFLRKQGYSPAYQE
jgi:hypothetical protein